MLSDYVNTNPHQKKILGTGGIARRAAAFAATFDAKDPRGRKGELTLSCPRSSTHTMVWVHTPTHTQAHAHMYTHVGTFKHSPLGGAASASTSSTHSRAKFQPSQTVLFIQYDCVYYTQQEPHAWFWIICISKSCIHSGYGMTNKPVWTIGKQKSSYS